MKLMHIGLKVFLVLFLFGLFFIPNDVFAAENLTGAWTMYLQNSNGNTLPTQYTSTLSGITFPSSSYTQVPGSTINTNPNVFTVVTRVDIQPTYTYVKGNSYTITLNFDTGSYIIPYFPVNSSNWFVSQCTNSLCNSTPNVTYTYTLDTSHQSTNTLQVVIKFLATSNTSNSTIVLGNLTDAKGNFYNQYSLQQGVRINSATIDEIDNSVDFTPLIDNQNQNTQDIINNNNQNTQNIINNQNIISQHQEELQKVCTNYYFDSTNTPLGLDNSYLSNLQGNVGSSSSWYLSDFISIPSSTEFTFIIPSSTFNGVFACWYGIDKSVISCFPYNSTSIVSTSPVNAKFLRFSQGKNYERIIVVSGSYCINGNQAINDTINDLNNTIKDDNSTGAVANADGNFSDVDLPNMGLQSLLNTIVSFIGNLFTQTCDPLVLPLPFVNQSVTLPCMSTIYSTHFNTFYVLWQTLLTGFIAYKVIINLFHKIHQLEDPNYDKVEVLDL